MTADALSSRLLDAIGRREVAAQAIADAFGQRWAVGTHIGNHYNFATVHRIDDEDDLVVRCGIEELEAGELLAAHIVSEDPASVLRLCQAHREIVEMYQDLDRRPRAGFMGDLERASANAKIVTLGLVLQALAKAYGIEEDPSGHSE